MRTNQKKKKEVPVEDIGCSGYEQAGDGDVQCTGMERMDDL